MLRNLLYFWRINLAVVLGAAVATAVLTGALLVGDSVRGSLRDLTLDRLGNVDEALVTDQFFRQKLAGDLRNNSLFKEGFSDAVPAILLTGSITNAESKTRASKVNIMGINDQFVSLFPEKPGSGDFAENLKKQPGQVFQAVIINESLQRELNINVGDAVLVALERESAIHRESLFGNKKSSDIIRSLRLMVSAIAPNDGIGRFGLRPNQQMPLNAYVSLPVLQRALEQRRRVNAVFVAAGAAGKEGSHEIGTILRNELTLNDLNLDIREGEGHASLESNEFVLKPQVAAAAREVLSDLDAPQMATLTYLANKLSVNDRITPYSTIAAFQTPVAEPFGAFQLTDGQPVPSLEENEILLNTWTAADLNASIGDSLEVVYYRVGLQEALTEDTVSLRIKGVIEMTGLGADNSLTPEFPGIHDADNIRDWDPPFPVDLDLVRQKDEAYWDDYKGTPKAFVSDATGEKLWRSRFGNLTAIRFAAAPGMTMAETIAEFRNRFREKMLPENLGFAFQPVKEQGLRAATGATDFSGLFIGFSFFLIISAALLVGLLFRLSVEQRAGEIGVLFSTGYSARQVLIKFMKEGLTLATVGCLLGLFGAVAYGWLMMAALRTLWVKATGTTFLFLHITPQSLVTGFLIGIIVVGFAIFRALWKLGKLPARMLLAGVIEDDGIEGATGLKKKKIPATRRMKYISLAALLGAIALLTAAVNADAAASPGLFFGSGALLLICGLTWLSYRMRLPADRKAVVDGVIGMAARNNVRKRSRSMLCVALVASACFMIVSVESFHENLSDSDITLQSGVGGYTLLAEADIPLLQSLKTQDGRFELGFSDKASAVLDSAVITPFRLLPGEDASCLNLYLPEKPRVLGVPQSQIARGGFSFFSDQTDMYPGIDSGNSWELLNIDIEPDVIPAFGDQNSVQWILHSGLGKDIVIQDEYGRDLKLRLVGLLQTSIFQSELLISEENFVKYFPGQSGDAYFLIENALNQSDDVRAALESTLGDYGFDVVSTTEKLAEYQVVANTYLSVFQMLGGLGLLLGTIGLGLVLFRNVIERRSEFATLRAFGFRKQRISQTLLAENSILILLGIAIGCISAFIAVAPHLFGNVTQFPWLSLSGIILLVLLAGVTASMIAIAIALKLPLLPALKAE